MSKKYSFTLSRKHSHELTALKIKAECELNEYLISFSAPIQRKDESSWFSEVVCKEKWAQGYCYDRL